MTTHDKYDNDILKRLTRIANALDGICKRLPEECDTAEKIENMTSGDYVQVTRCRDCKCFILLDDIKKDSEYKDYPFEAAEKVHADGICINTDKWVCTDEFCSGGAKSQKKHTP